MGLPIPSLREIQGKCLVLPVVNQYSSIENITSDETIEVREVSLWDRHNECGNEEIG